MKKCTKCDTIKGFEEFHKDVNKADGYRTICKECRVPRSAKHYKDNSDEIKAKVKTYWLRSRYGIGMDELESLLARQDYSCLICEESISESYHIDHNHDSGEVRGLLCGCCNRGLGIFKDSPDRLLNAHKYLIERGHYGP